MSKPRVSPGAFYNAYIKGQYTHDGHSQLCEPPIASPDYRPVAYSSTWIVGTEYDKRTKRLVIWTRRHDGTHDGIVYLDVPHYKVVGLHRIPANYTPTSTVRAKRTEEAAMKALAASVEMAKAGAMIADMKGQTP